MAELLQILSMFLSAILAAFSAYQGTKRAAEERERQHAASIARLETKIAQLETKLDLLSERVEKHNNVMERTFKLETEVSNLKERYNNEKD